MALCDIYLFELRRRSNGSYLPCVLFVFRSVGEVSGIDPQRLTWQFLREDDDGLVSP